MFTVNVSAITGPIHIKQKLLFCVGSGDVMQLVKIVAKVMLKMKILILMDLSCPPTEFPDVKLVKRHDQ